MIESFRKFARLAEKAVVINADDRNALRAAEGIPTKKLMTYGIGGGSDWHAENIRFTNGSFGQYDLYHKGEFFSAVRLGVPGEYNISNSMAAAAAAHFAGATAEQIAQGLQSFRGAGRRFEFLGTFAGITVADDYARHPTEIAATLNTAKAMGYQRVWAVFQPFTYSRTVRHFDGFVHQTADKKVKDIMVATINKGRFRTAGKTIRGGISAEFEQIDYVSTNAAEGDLVLTMGGGDIYKCARMIVSLLKQKVGHTV